MIFIWAKMKIRFIAMNEKRTYHLSVDAVERTTYANAIITEQFS